jgi:CheY-like chemotaxis protein
LPDRPLWKESLLSETVIGVRAKAHGAASRKCGILVADDEAWVRGLLDIAMRREGFAVWLAANGHEVVEMYRCQRETIDAVLLDICMPGLDGPPTLAALQELNPQIRAGWPG